MDELVVKRYSSGLFDLAVENNNVEIINEQVSNIKNILEKEKDFLELLNDPKISMEEKIKILEKCFKNMIQEEILGFLVLIVKKSRQKFLLEILDNFIEKVRKHKLIAIAKVTSAVNLTENQIQNIKSILDAKLNKKVEIESIIDETIIGGLIIQVENILFDRSVKGKLNNWKELVV